MKIAALVDSFINPVHFSNANTLRRARLFVRGCWLTSIFSTTYIWLSMVFSYDKGIYLMIFNVIAFLLLPFLAKTRIPIAWLGNVFIFVGAFAIIVLTYYSGGVWSAVYPWIISIPVLALLVVNRLSGSIWGGISFLFMLWFAFIAYQGKELPVEYNPELRTLWYISVLPGLLLIILFIAFVFESIQTKALTDLEDKNELLETQKEMIAAQSTELKKHIEEKDYIIRILAHDLRSPLKNINSLVRLMEFENDPVRHKDYISMITQSSSNAQHLVNRVLEMDASSQEDFDLKMERIDLYLLLTEVVDNMAKPANEKRIQIRLSNQSSNCTVLADKTYLYLILENLMSNAIKFSENGKEVQASVFENGSSVQVKIMDEGPGINPEEESRLFKKFSKLSARPTGGESSTGLGLSLVKRYVELISGQVYYEAAESGGATFVVELPLIDQAAAS
ncbi:sensor histidine kinase [Fulvivirga imtechensis]|nr:HAMP domain-containing sensor histidine kinase [Fulvivirga imtechensis]